jgi:hypothetical protein
MSGRAVVRFCTFWLGASQGRHHQISGTIKYPVGNPVVLRYLRQLLPGKWQKVIKDGNLGEVHYFEHASGQVAGVKFFADGGPVMDIS